MALYIFGFRTGWLWLFPSSTVVEAGTFGENLMASLEAMSGTILRPNVLLVRMPETDSRREELATVIGRAREKRVGILLLAEHKAAGLGLEGTINVWVDEMSPDWELKMDMGGFDLALLIGYKLVETAGSSCLFAMDSGIESALA